MNHSDAILHYASEAALLAARSGSSLNVGGSSRPASFKAIGISLAVASGLFIGVSFVLKKYGLLKANEKYHEEAGEGYGYLKNFYWWSGMTLMILGEICNFVAYAFTDAILVTPLGALSVVITTVLSAIFLKERLSLVGKVACFLCIVGSVVIVMNAPESSSVANIQEMQHYVIAPGFLSYAGVVIVGAICTAIFAAPRWGKKNMLVYISICSWVGGLSVVAIQGLGAAIVAQAQGESQFNQWFLYVLLVFVVSTLVTEIIYLNATLNLFNAALVTPTYYVYFTTTTIISSTVLFRGMHGTTTSIITMVNGFLTICAGVVLLQLSKSSKDVPDAAVFNGDLDQIQTIAEQEQPETEPKADAIRGTAAIVRQISMTRQKRELEEFERLRQEKEAERLTPLNAGDMYEWDGIRRRRTLASRSSVSSRGTSIGPSGYGLPPGSSASNAPSSYLTPMRAMHHPPLGMSRFHTEEEIREMEAEELRRVASPSLIGSISGTIRGRRRSTVPPTVPEDSPTRPVALTELRDHGAYYSHTPGYDLEDQSTEYHGAGATSYGASGYHDVTSAPPTHSARRQFSFQNLFRRAHTQSSAPAPMADGERDRERERHSKRDSNHSGRHALGLRRVNSNEDTEEERLGLVKPDGNNSSFQSGRDEEEDFYEEKLNSTMVTESRYNHGMPSGSPTQSLASPSSSEGEASPPPPLNIRNRQSHVQRIGGPYDVERLYNMAAAHVDDTPPLVPQHRSRQSIARHSRGSAAGGGSGSASGSISGLSFPSRPTTSHRPGGQHNRGGSTGGSAGGPYL
ncbi:hypothetical protein TD95_005242 [Thielaviopsis punctulata]|uniref:Uncharacterized protein n=1 Tax=Thielaviopsis punctulata TaxID=72032 RepID=A0A0F4ZD25_9PEZI|nr:hypothetical protein TD95_005242 [Thielaviopsis punctulata]